MKNLLYTICTALLLVSCCFGYDDYTGRPMVYYMGFVFQDSAGNNLSAGIGIKDWYPSNVPQEEASSGTVSECKLDVILGNPGYFDNKNYCYVLPGEDVSFDHFPPKLRYFNYEEGVLLSNEMQFFMNWTDPQEIITYKLSLPYIFGDDDVHTITTYWQTEFEKPRTGHREALPECYKVEFDGKVITDIVHKGTFNRKNVVTLTIDR